MSMYNSHLVAAIKVNGQILRESGDTVSLPFGAEYSILLKNLNSVRAQVTVSVDGADATDGMRLIIPPNSSIELERFIRNGNLSGGNRFKFIERSAGIEKHRGIGSDDGLIRVEGWKEYVQPVVNVPVPNYVPYEVPVPYYPRPWPHYPHYPYSPYWGTYSNTTNASANTANTSSGSAGTLRGGQLHAKSSPSRPGSPTMKGPGVGRAKIPPRPDMQAKGTSKVKFRSFDSGVTLDSAFERERSDEGITVPGSQSSQQFHSVQGFRVEPQSVVIVLRLRGQIEGVPVSVPLTVNTKPSCVTCGKTNKSNSQYCSACGTALVLV